MASNGSGKATTAAKLPLVTAPAPPRQTKPSREVNAKKATLQAATVDDDDDVVDLQLLNDSELQMVAEADALALQTEACERALRDLQLRVTTACRRLVRLELRCPTALVWRIDDVAAKVKAARSGQIACLDSPVQYVSRLGYRFALRASLNGDGRARGKCVSLFVCICRGEFDCLLEWPFKMRIYLSILDQTPEPGDRRDLTRVIMPNACSANAAFLGKPCVERNPHFGIEEFAQQERVFGTEGPYVRDNTMYFRMEIPTEDLYPEFN